jgi:hypothetical protein
MLVANEDFEQKSMLVIADYGMPLPENIGGVNPYRVIGGIAPLFGMRHPMHFNEDERKRLAEELYAAGVRHLINLSKEAPDTSYLGGNFLTTFCAITDQGPQNSVEERTLSFGVDAALRALKQGEGVVIHCHGGTGRTGTAIGCILRKLGKGSGNQIVSWLNKLNINRGKRGWPEDPTQEKIVKACHMDTTFL